jgi:hypothetical protein
MHDKAPTAVLCHVTDTVTTAIVSTTHTHRIIADDSDCYYSSFRINFDSYGGAVVSGKV